MPRQIRRLLRSNGEEDKGVEVWGVISGGGGGGKSPPRRRHSLPPPSRAMRVRVFNETMDVIADNRALSDRVASSIQATNAFRTDPEVDEIFEPVMAMNKGRNINPMVIVYEGDCLTAADILHQCLPRSYFRSSVAPVPCVLNMANSVIPGGDAEGGAGAQEENLCRRTTVYPILSSLERKFYPLAGRCLMTPGVVVFRGEEQNGYPVFADTPGPKLPTVSVISVAAPAYPPLVRIGTDLIVKPDSLERRQLAQAVRNCIVVPATKTKECKPHRVVVLSALGCGAFANPPNDVANMFSRAIGVGRGHGINMERSAYPSRPIYDHSRSTTAMLARHIRSKTVSAKPDLAPTRIYVFAIFDDQNAKRAHNPIGNVAPFEDAFGLQRVSGPAALYNLIHSMFGPTKARRGDAYFRRRHGW